MSEPHDAGTPRPQPEADQPQPHSQSHPRPLGASLFGLKGGGRPGRPRRPSPPLPAPRSGIWL